MVAIIDPHHGEASGAQHWLMAIVQLIPQCFVETVKKCHETPQLTYLAAAEQLSHFVSVDLFSMSQIFVSRRLHGSVVNRAILCNFLSKAANIADGWIMSLGEIFGEPLWIARLTFPLAICESLLRKYVQV